MSLYLGVDAGATTTTYVLAHDHAEIARAQSGSIKRMRVSEQQAALHLCTALDDLERRSARKLQDVTRTCIGAAGFSVPLVADWLTTAFAERVSGELVLVGDVVIALDAAFRGGRGVLVLAGTGSNVAARTADGQLTNAGGWGPVISDEGAGSSIGRDAVRAVFHAFDADEHTLLTERVSAFWQADLADMVAKVNTQPPPDFARLVPLVLEAAREGDAAALDVLRQSGRTLGRTTLLAIAKLRRIEGVRWDGPPPVACAGSVLRYVEPVREAVVARLREDYADIQVLPDTVEPVAGAVWRAQLAADAVSLGSVAR